MVAGATVVSGTPETLHALIITSSSTNSADKPLFGTYTFPEEAVLVSFVSPPLMYLKVVGDGMSKTDSVELYCVPTPSTTIKSPATRP